jgi:hypothetical protein
MARIDRKRENRTIISPARIPENKYCALETGYMDLDSNSPEGKRGAEGKGG